MASNRKRKKVLWMSVKKMIKEVKSYNHKFTYKYGCGYFIFTFKNNEYNLHITFDKLPDMRFGIWYTTIYGDDKYYFFAEHDAYLDKFKPTAVKFRWNTLDQMMTFVHDSINDKEYYKGQLLYAYNHSNLSIEEWDKRTNELLKRDNGFTFEEKKECLRKFNEFINSIDTNKIDIFWTKSNLYGKLYDVFYYVEENMTDDELNELERKIDECDCFPVAGLTLHYWKHRKKYQMKIHPENIKLYTNYKIWRRYFKE